MNRRTHLMLQIDLLKPFIKSPLAQKLLSDARYVAEWDEEEITDLISQVKFLEQQLDGCTPPLPEYDPDDDEEK